MRKRAGDSLLAGSINRESPLLMRVTAVGRVDHARLARAPRRARRGRAPADGALRRIRRRVVRGPPAVRRRRRGALLVAPRCVARAAGGVRRARRLVPMRACRSPRRRRWPSPQGRWDAGEYSPCGRTRSNRWRVRTTSCSTRPARSPSGRLADRRRPRCKVATIATRASPSPPRSKRVRRIRWPTRFVRSARARPMRATSSPSPVKAWRAASAGVAIAAAARRGSGRSPARSPSPT